MAVCCKVAGGGNGNINWKKCPGCRETEGQYIWKNKLCGYWPVTTLRRVVAGFCMFWKRGGWLEGLLLPVSSGICGRRCSAQKIKVAYVHHCPVILITIYSGRTPVRLKL